MQFLNTRSRRSRGRCAIQVFVLTALLAGIGFCLVPAHLSSFWADQEFTGLSLGVAHHLSGGSRLYTEGGHVPLSPLSFLLLRGIAGGHGPWILESAANFLFQVLALLILGLGAARRLRNPLPILGVLAALPITFALRKLALYDSMVQCLAASVIAGAGLLVTGAPRDRWKMWIWVAGLGFLSSAALLTKQTTGLGVMLGTAALLALVSCRGPRPLPRRTIGVYLAGVMGGFALICALLHPWMNLRGLITDVFLTGGEPKGGSPVLCSRALTLLGEVLRVFIRPGGWTAVGLWWAFRSRKREEGPEHAWLVFAAAIVLSAVIFGWANREPPVLAWIGDGILDAALASALLVAGEYAFFPGKNEFLAAGSFVALPAALLTNLSVRGLRWDYDNNPLVFFALVTLIGFFWRPFGRRASVVGIGFLLLSGAALGSRMSRTLSLAWDCDRTFPEIPHLRYARLRRSAEGIRQVVKMARYLAPDPTRDSVLFLPTDLDVESWFERPFPRLSCVDQFTDMCWVKYVETDLRSLEENPPRVIVLGPEEVFGQFQASLNTGRQTEKLIQGIRARILPGHYTHFMRSWITIDFFGTRPREQYLDIYVRN